MARDQKPKKMTAQLKVTSQCRRGKAHLIIIIEHEHRHWISHNQYWILLLFLFFSFHCRNYDFVTTAFLHPNTRAYSALYRKRTKLDRFYQVTSASSPEVTTSPQYTVPRQKYKNSNGSSNNYQRHTKLKIKRMFQKAQDLTRTGQWWDASRILEDILEIDPRDAHSHLALARLESRREFASTATSKCTSSATDQPNPSISVTNNNGRRHYSSNNTLLWATTITNHSTIPTTTAQTYDNDKHHYSPLLIIGNNTTAQIMDIPPLPSPTSSPARAAFYRGTKLCPKSIHLWQAWALHEQSMGNLQDARTLFQICLTMDSRNAHVCHAFGLMERRLGNHDQAQELWTVALEVHSTAALVCSLGELYIVRGQLEQARTLYENHLFRVSTERERTELYLAMAWLEERYLANRDRALECIQTALSASPNNSRAQVALARLQGRREADLQQQNQAIHTHAPQHNNTSHSYTNNNSRVNNMRLSKKTTSVDPNNISLLQHQDSNALTRLHFAEACEKESTKCDRTASTTTTTSKSDGRLFNAWANLEAKSGRLKNARRILLQGIKRFPHDHSLLQAVGNVEERLGNFAKARDYYAESLGLEPSAPAIVSYALLELHHPKLGTEKPNITMVEKLFEEALLIDPRHGPTYNAYGTMKYRITGDLESARQIFESGVRARCKDPASVYHGYAKLELAAGNIGLARNILEEGLRDVQRQENAKMGTNYQQNRAVFLVHTLGMLELKSGQIVKAKDVFDDGIKNYGNSSQLLLGAALCDVKLGKQDTARHFFKRAIAADRRHAHAWHAWGLMELRAGQFRAAKILFENGLRNSPLHGPLWHAYAYMESKTSNISQARILFAAGVAKCPNHIPLYHMWALLELRQGHISSAKKLIGEALTRDKTLGTGWLIAARIEETLGHHGLVKLILARGLECAPNCPELYCALSDTYLKKGKIEEARNLLEKGLEVDPLNAPLYHALAELEARVFNLEGLAKLNKRVSEIFNSNALIPSKESTRAWEKKLKRGKNNLISGKSLVDFIGFDLEKDDVSVRPSFELHASIAATVPESVIASMSRFEDEVVGEIFSWETDDLIKSG